MKNLYTVAVLLPLMLRPAFGEGGHLDIMVPDRTDTDLAGIVKSVDTKTSVNVSGEFTRSYKEYDRTGNLVIETEWDAKGVCLNSLTNYYSDDGHFERQLYIDFEDEYTNDWEVIVHADSRQMAKRMESGAAAVYTYSPAGYLVNYRFVNSDKKVTRGSRTRRDEFNRPLEYTKLDEKGKPVYTYWFKWKDKRTIDRERQKYRKEEAERLHIYDYIETDPVGNWTQRLMVRYDIGGKKKEKVFERVVTRSLEYFDEELSADAAADTPFAEEEVLAAAESTNAPAVRDSVDGGTAAHSESAPLDTTSPSAPEQGDSGGADSSPTALDTTSSTAGTEPSEADDSLAAESLDALDVSSKYIQYSFEELSDKVVIISCKSSKGRSFGSGFIASMDGKTYLLTNQHVILGTDSFVLKTADGEMLRPLGVELSLERDIARIRIDDRDSFDISRKIALGMQIGVFGNSEGAGVATELLGEVTDFGADVVEITAEFVGGNSGSPVLNSRQEVIGIASFTKTLRIPNEDEDEDEDEDETDEDENEEDEEDDQFKVRRFCYRLTDVEWKPVRWKEYNKKYGGLYLDSEETSKKIFDLIDFWNEDWMRKIPQDSSLGPDLRQWIKEHNELVSRAERRGFSSSRAIHNAYADNVDKLADTCRARARRISMFSSQRELTGFIGENLEHSSLALEYAQLYFQVLAEYLREEGKK